MKKLYIETHGCQMNEYDSSKISDLLEAKNGVVKTNNPHEADIILLNTCSVREKAEEKVFSQLGRFREIKKQKPDLVIGVGGCVASQEGHNILKRAPYVDVIFGPQTIHRVHNLISESNRTKKSQIDVSFPEIEKFDKLVTPNVSNVDSYVSIMEGCNKFCTFCIVPYTRGNEISRPIDDIVKEIKLLLDKGVKEIMLLGQNVNAYRYAKDGQVVDFTELLYKVSALDGLERLRYTTSHPIEFTSDVIEAHANIKNLVKFLHLPVQSGSDKVLNAMKRGYTALEYKSKIRELKRKIPQMLVSSDFIVGFPGEDENDFNKTLKLIEDLDLDFSFSFIYSARPGTPASSIPDTVTLDEKKRRLSLLQHRLSQQGFAHSQNMIGTVQKILVTDFSKKSNDFLHGRTEHNRVVNFPSDNASLIGNFVDVKIEEALPNSLRGHLFQ